MRTMTNKIQLLMLAIFLFSGVALAQAAPKDSTKIDTTKIKMDSTKAKILAKTDMEKKDVKTAMEKVVDNVTPNKSTEVAKISTPKSNITLTADPTMEAVFHRGSLVIGAGIVYQKELLPIMLVGEYGLGRNIGVEVRSWYGSKTENGILYRDGFFGVGLNYHFTGDIRSSASRFDAFVGGLYGKILDETGSAVYAQAGAKYFFFRKLGIFGNFNVGLIGSRGTNLSFGIAYSIF